MSKSTFFTGQPIFSQLLNLVDRSTVKALARAGKHDRYYKQFDTYAHLVTMLYCTLNKCTSSREVVSGMKACTTRLRHAGIVHAPGKSTLCDANKKVHSRYLPISMAVCTSATGIFCRTAELITAPSFLSQTLPPSPYFRKY